MPDYRIVGHNSNISLEILQINYGDVSSPFMTFRPEPKPNSAIGKRPWRRYQVLSSRHFNTSRDLNSILRFQSVIIQDVKCEKNEMREKLTGTPVGSKLLTNRLS